MLHYCHSPAFQSASLQFLSHVQDILCLICLFLIDHTVQFRSIFFWIKCFAISFVGTVTRKIYKGLVERKHNCSRSTFWKLSTEWQDMTLNTNRSKVPCLFYYFSPFHSTANILPHNCYVVVCNWRQCKIEILNGQNHNFKNPQPTCTRTSLGLLRNAIGCQKYNNCRKYRVLNV